MERADLHSADVLNRFQQIRSTKDRHINLVKSLARPGQPIYFTHLFIIGILNRSIALATGFADVVENNNYVCAAPLVRMQIDNIARLEGALVAEHMDDFCRAVFKGERIDRMKDAKGRRMTDKYLIGIIRQEHSWIQKGYEACGGYVHLSDKHILSHLRSHKYGEFIMKVTGVCHDLEERHWQEIVGAFQAATDALEKKVTEMIPKIPS